MNGIDICQCSTVQEAYTHYPEGEGHSCQWCRALAVLSVSDGGSAVGVGQWSLVSAVLSVYRPVADRTVLGRAPVRSCVTWRDDVTRSRALTSPNSRQQVTGEPSRGWRHPRACAERRLLTLWRKLDTVVTSLHAVSGY